MLAAERNDEDVKRGETGQRRLFCADLRREQCEWGGGIGVVKEMLPLQIEIRTLERLQPFTDKLIQLLRRQEEIFAGFIHRQHAIVKTRETKRQKAVRAGRGELLAAAKVRAYQGSASRRHSMDAASA